MNVIIKPLLTEKSNLQATKLNRYGFIVDKRANKVQIKNSVKELYAVEPLCVNTINYDGKSKGRFTKAGYIAGKENAFKKAYVTLREGDKIDFYSNI